MAQSLTEAVAQRLRQGLRPGATAAQKLRSCGCGVCFVQRLIVNVPVIRPGIPSRRALVPPGPSWPWLPPLWEQVLPTVLHWSAHLTVKTL